MKRLARISALFLLAVLAAHPVAAQKQPTPTETVVAFYRLLREHRYVEGFALSVYGPAIEGLSESDLAELTPDFQRTFADIPEKINVEGEQISTDAATVFVRFGGGEVEPVALVRQNGRWLVGDEDTRAQVDQDRAAFFFNARVDVNQTEALKIVRQINTAQQSWRAKTKKYASLQELISGDVITEDLRAGSAAGYKFEINLNSDKTAYTATAIPVRYGRTGALSFFTDGASVRAADVKGSYAGLDAPLVPAEEATQLN